MPTIAELQAYPEIQAIDQVSQDAIRNRIIAKVREILPDWDLEESDPGYQIINVMSGHMATGRHYANSRIRSNYFPYTSGSDLDHRVADNGLQRQTSETDFRLMTRALNEPFTRSAVGTPEAVLAHTATSSPEVVDSNFIILSDLSVALYIIATSTGKRTEITQPKLTPVVGDGNLTGIRLTNFGSGYRSAPTITITGGGGSGATAEAIYENRRLGGVRLTNPGLGYTSPPTITITGGGGSGAAATAEIDAGLKSISVDDGGSGYLQVPEVYVVGGGSSAEGATATADIDSGAITGIKVNTSGNGYSKSNPPAILVVGGGTIEELPGRPSPELLTEVRNYVNDRSRRHITDNYRVLRPQLINYYIAANVKYDSRVSILTDVQTAVNDAINTFVRDSIRLGEIVSLSRINSALQQSASGVVAVDLHTPSMDPDTDELMFQSTGESATTVGGDLTPHDGQEIINQVAWSCFSDAGTENPQSILLNFEDISIG